MSARIDYASLTERRCSRCSEVKLVAEFNRYVDATAPLTRWRYYSWCRRCSNGRARTYGIENRGRRNARLRGWRRTNPEAAKAGDQRARLQFKYGLTEAEVAKMAERQQGLCALCQRRIMLVIDHDHATGRVRGLLCHRCNLCLGRLENGTGDRRGWLSRPEVADRLEAYLS